MAVSQDAKLKQFYKVSYLGQGDEGPGCQQALKEQKQHNLTYDRRSSTRSDFASTIGVSHKPMTADRTQGTGVVSRAAVARLEGAKAEII